MSDESEAFGLAYDVNEDRAPLNHALRRKPRLPSGFSYINLNPKEKLSKPTLIDVALGLYEGNSHASKPRINRNNEFNLTCIAVSDKTDELYFLQDRLLERAMRRHHYVGGISNNKRVH